MPTSRVIVLADPPVARHCAHASAFPNLGLLSLAACLRQRFPDADVRYLDAHWSFVDHVAHVRALRPAIYGLSFASPYANVAATVIAAIKAASPATFVVCGGAHPSAEPAAVLAQTEADVVVIGEGERTVTELFAAALERDDLTGIAGIAFRTGGDAPFATPPRPLVADLDALPFPAWDLVDLHRFTGCRQSRGTHSTAIVASRGCPYECVFCSNPVWRVSEPWHRVRSPAAIAEEVELLYRRGVREVYLRSDEMNVDVRWAVAVFDRLAGLGHADLVFQCNLRATPVTAELVDALVHARCWLCHVGIESGSQRVLDGVRKRVTLDQIRTALALLKRRGVKTYGFFMMYQAWRGPTGLCFESTDEVIETLKFVLELRAAGLVDYISWNFATPYPNSALHATALAFDLLLPSAQRRSVLLPWDISLRLPGIPRWEMAGMRALGMLVQGALHASDRDTYNLRTLRGNLRHASRKVRYSVGL